MAKSIIIYGVPGGKTRFAQRIADHFGCVCHQTENVMRMYCEGSIGFVDSEEAGKEWERIGFEARSFQSVADEINATISLTDWQSGPPPMVGEWEVQEEGSLWRRWWDGECWSFAWAIKKGRTIMEVPFLTHKKDFMTTWRGLSSEPIKVTE